MLAWMHTNIHTEFVINKALHTTPNVNTLIKKNHKTNSNFCYFFYICIYFIDSAKHLELS